MQTPLQSSVALPYHGTVSLSQKAPTTVLTQVTPLVQSVVNQFLAPGRTAEFWAYGNGNINQTYLVTPVGVAPFLLQQLNTQVFLQPELIMQNIQRVSRHLETQAVGDRRWEIPYVLPTTNGRDHVQAADGTYWRALTYIGRSRTLETVSDLTTAREVGHALGVFHAQLANLPVEDLAITLPGFHITPGYLAHYDTFAAVGDSADERWCSQFVAEHRDWVPVLERAREEGLLRVRPIHGDPKVNNILFDDVTGQAIAMIDWDTLMPGLVQYDIGDCLRSSCNPAGEETADWRAVTFDLVLGQAVLAGYLDAARGFLDPADFDFIPESARLIAFELGLRFFTDHLAGDVYFNVSRRGQNLARACVQFRLAQSIDAQFDELRAIVNALR